MRNSEHTFLLTWDFWMAWNKINFNCQAVCKWVKQLGEGGGFGTEFRAERCHGGDLQIAKIVLHSLWPAPVMSLNWGNLVQTKKIYFQEVYGQLDNFTPAVLN